MLDAVIAGAGLAGLYTARLLKQAGLDVAVLEARDRVGGRAWSRPIGNGVAIDLGAQWIGPHHRRMHALARELGVPTVPTHTAGAIVISSGRGPRRQSRTALPLSWAGSLDAARLAWKLSRLAARTDPVAPWRRPDASRLDGLAFDTWVDRSAWTDEARRYWRFLAESATCAPASSLSVLEMASQVASVGGLQALETAEQDFFATGAQAIAERLAGGLGDCVRLGMPVTAVRAVPGGVCVLAGTQSFSAGHAILTVPPPLLAAIDIDAPLADLTTARASASVSGRVIKYIAVYERAWWRDRGLSGTALDLDGPVTAFVDGAGEAGVPGVLVALVTARHAAELARAPAAERDARVVSQIDRVLGGAPGPPESLTATDWTAEPWSLGGYAARRGLGGWTLEAAPIDSAAPVLFAGTETAHEWRGYMEGALESAERVAASVVSRSAKPR